MQLSEPNIKFELSPDLVICVIDSMLPVDVSTNQRASAVLMSFSLQRTKPSPVLRIKNTPKPQVLMKLFKSLILVSHI